MAARRRLVRFSPLLLAQSLPRKGFFGSAFLTGLHIEAMLLDFLDDVFLLHLALETAQCVFQRLTFLDNDFSHFYIHPQSGSDWLRAASLLGSNTAPVIIAWQLPRGHAHRQRHPASSCHGARNRSVPRRPHVHLCTIWPFWSHPDEVAGIF